MMYVSTGIPSWIQFYPFPLPHNNSESDPPTIPIFSLAQPASRPHSVTIMGTFSSLRRKISLGRPQHDVRTSNQEIGGGWHIVPASFADLTFGVELEFAIATLDPGTRDPEPDDGRCVYNQPQSGQPLKWTYQNMHQHIAATLSKIGIRAATDDANASWNRRGPHKEAWIVKKDASSSVRIKNDSLAYKWYAIEVVSPVLQFSNESLCTVKNVCAALSKRYRIETNSTAGLHVHVGNRNQGFDFPAMQRLAGILWTFDSQISTIHSDYRREKSEFCRSFRTHSMLSEVLSNSKAASGSDLLLGGLSCIFHGVSTIVELKKLMSPGENVSSADHRGAYFMGNIHCSKDSDSQISKPTIEFRQHEATLDVTRVIHWITLCVRMVECARKSNTEGTISFLESHAQKPVDLSAVLRQLGMAEEAAFYERQVPLDEIEREKEKKRRKAAGEEEEETFYKIKFHG